MEPTLVASLIGLLATTQIHIAKGMQKYGILAFQAAGRESLPAKGRRNRKVLYYAGIVLNNAAFLWVLVANLYAPTSYYTSVFGFGLVVLMVFSELFLHEKHSMLQHLGAYIIAAGTILVGIGHRGAEAPGMGLVNQSIVLNFVFIVFPLLLLILIILLIFKKKKPLGLVFGLTTGCAAAMDPIFKGIGQSIGSTVHLLPQAQGGWIFFLASFIFGALAFLFTQFGFYQNARASTLVAFHNVTLIVTPLFLLKLSLPGFSLSHPQVFGILIVVAGIFLMFSETTVALIARFMKSKN